MINADLKEWISKEKANKSKWLNMMYGRDHKKLTQFEKDNMKQVYGKLMFIDDLERKIRVIEKRKGQKLINFNNAGTFVRDR